MKKEAVNHPSHYNQSGIECIDAMAAATVNKTGIEAVDVSNVIKYLWRYEAKNGLEDVLKAEWYLNHLIKHLKSKQMASSDDYITVYLVELHDIREGSPKIDGAEGLFYDRTKAINYADDIHNKFGVSTTKPNVTITTCDKNCIQDGSVYVIFNVDGSLYGFDNSISEKDLALHNRTYKLLKIQS